MFLLLLTETLTRRISILPSLHSYLKTLLTFSKPAKPLSQGNQTISAETHFLRGNACYKLELYHLAIANYDKAIQLKPDYAGIILQSGELRNTDLGQYFAADK